MLAVVSSGIFVRIFIILGNLIILGRSRRSGKDGLSEYHVVAPLGFYILRNLMIPRQFPEDCQSTTKCFFTFLILFPYDVDDVISDDVDDVISTLC
jgi:hypothetical protein